MAQCRLNGKEKKKKRKNISKVKENLKQIMLSDKKRVRTQMTNKYVFVLILLTKKKDENKQRQKITKDFKLSNYHCEK